MNKKQAEEFTTDVLITDALLRLKTLENLLITKGIFSKEEFAEEMKSITSIIAKTILQRSEVGGDLDKLINTLSDNTKKDNHN